MSVFVHATSAIGNTSQVGPTIGNGVMSLGFLLTNNPLTAIFSHMTMHIAGVLHGPAFVMQLPPH